MQSNAIVCRSYQTKRCLALRLTDRYMTSAGLETTKQSNYDEVNR